MGLVPFVGDLPVVPVMGLQLSSATTIEERLDFIDKINEYVGTTVVKFEDLNLFFEEKRPTALVHVHGLIVKPLSPDLDKYGNFYDAAGVAKHGYVTLIKITEGDDPTIKILLFQSILATNWGKLMMATFGCIADWPQVVTFKIKKIPAKVGHTFTFTRIKQ